MKWTARRFAALLLLPGFCGAAVSHAAPASAPSSQRSADVLNFPSFGVSVRAPAGWARPNGKLTDVGATTTVTFLIRRGHHAFDGGDLIVIEIGPKIGIKEAPSMAGFA